MTDGGSDALIDKYTTCDVHSITIPTLSLVGLHKDDDRLRRYLKRVSLVLHLI